MSRLERAPNDDWRNREAQRRRARGQAPELVDVGGPMTDFTFSIDLSGISDEYEKLLDARRVADRKREEAERDAPTFSECVIGYRQWLVDALGQLWPVSMPTRPWEPGVNTAVCDAGNNPFSFGPPSTGPAHKAPHAGCECGLYAWRRVKREWLTGEGRLLAPCMPPALGAVAFWGDVRVHRAGFRAEKACIVTLAHYDDERPEVIAVLERVARRYRVDLVPLRELEAAASQHGTPLPESLQPARSPTAAQYLSLGIYQTWLSNGSGPRFTVSGP